MIEMMIKDLMKISLQDFVQLSVGFVLQINNPAIFIVRSFLWTSVFGMTYFFFPSVIMLKERYASYACCQFIFHFICGLSDVNALQISFHISFHSKNK